MKSPITHSLQTLREKRSQIQVSRIPDRPVATASLSRTSVVLMIAISAVCLFFGLSGYKTLASHEVFTAVGAREMIATGDYIVPHQAGLPRLKKPPLGYWVIVAVAKLTGQVDEFSSRLPAAIAAGLLCLLMGVWASRWYGRNAGIFAAFAQATTAFVILYSRKSEVDMCLTLFNTAAMFLIVFQPAGQSWKAGFVRWLGIFALLGLSTMSKFHYGPAMVLVPCALFWAVQRRWGEFKHTINPVGWLLWLGPIGVWIGLVLARIPNAVEIWQLETIGRAVGELSSWRPIWFFLGPILWMTLPWTLLWLWEVPRSWRAAVREGNANERFVWCWLLAQLAIVSLQPDKHPQYILSALPLFALW
ncbi:MAG TPA: glycosyltransferase family 39 protein, partial [Planctomycetaceae bacterium]|nr:glycosyltransferase family 39 protein [Planctomycetaceae bacterium]